VVAPPPTPQSQLARAVSETDALARGMKDGGVGGFVGGTSTLAGEINFKGMMRVDGRLSGRVKSPDGTLIVSSGGRVEAQVEVAVAKVNGAVEGDITATERIELGRTARVSGNLQTPALVVEDGAIFEGGCRMTAAAAAPARARNAA
jgi:cytoskeletal protein CcmA (bactofilin family)